MSQKPEAAGKRFFRHLAPCAAVSRAERNWSRLRATFWSGLRGENPLEVGDSSTTPLIPRFAQNDRLFRARTPGDGAGESAWTTYEAGTFFKVPGKSGFDIKVPSGIIAEYVCSFE